MSRIGYKPIPVPSNTEVKIMDNNEVTAKGPKGELHLQVDPDLILKLEEGILTVDRPTEQKRHKAMHGLYRSLLANIIQGVSEGFKKELIMNGVGFRASSQGQVLELSVGFSHPVIMVVPPEVKVKAETVKGKSPTITLESHDKQLLGQVAAKIRAVRKPEPYKGKGIRYSDEYIRRKAGKAAAK